MSRQIMVVDDDDGIRALVGIMLERGGFTVLKASDAHNALEMLEQTTPDLFILDLMMPEMDGLELCRLLRACPETIQTPVLILSASSDTRSRDRALEAGADSYLTKPVLRHELVTKVRWLLESKEGK